MKLSMMLKSLLTLLLVMVVTQAHALTLTTGDADWWGTETGVPEILVELAGLSGPDLTALDLLYKAEVEDPVVEEGLLAGSYETVFTNSSTDPEDATITHVDGTTAIVCPECYLLVKDGNQDPSWYVFDLSLWDWDGEETIYLEDFWVGNGAISHVALYGVSVPEPSQMLLLGTCLVGLAGSRLRRKKKK